MAFWVFLVLALIFPLPPVLGMLDCDPAFVKNLDLYLSSKLPKDLPNREAFLENVNKEILGIYRTFFRDEQYFRIIDTRSAAKLKKMVFDNLKGIEFHEMNSFLVDIHRIKQGLRLQMKQSLEHFADLACSEDCSVTEGPVLDCWTCLRIRAQCFKGSVCGEQDDLVTEKHEIGVYLALLLEFVIVFSILILFYHCYKKKTMLLKEKETILLFTSKKEIEDGSQNI